MKRCLDVICIVLMLLFFPHCGREKTQQMERQGSETHAALAEIDSLMWRQPDSAFVLLQEFVVSPEVEELDTFDGHYCQVLISELLYKNDFEQTNRTELLQAVAYFDSLVREAPPLKWGRGDSRHKPNPNADLAFLAARAHYINGVGYYERDSVVEACEEYYKALEVMEDRFGEKELVGEKIQFVALIYTRLSMLFSDMYLHEQAIFFAQQSLTYYKKLNMPIWYIARMLNEIGSQYDMMKNSDSAVCYYQKAINILDDTTTLMYRDIAVHLIIMEYKKSVCQTNSVIKRLRQLLLCSESEKESQVRYMNIGEIFYYEQRYDSAWVYLNKVFQMTSVVSLKRQAAEWLLEIGKAENMEVRAYTDFLAPFANQEENKSEIKSQLTELYKAFRQAQLERQHKKEMQRHHVQSMVVVAGLLLVILIVFALYHNNKRHKRHLENQIIEEKQVHSMEKKALSSRLKKSNETLRGLQDQIKQQNRNSSIRSETQAATFWDEPICRLIMERVHSGHFKAQINCSIYKDYALSKEQLVALQDAANQHFDLFTVRLVQAYPYITKSDLDYCCLHLLGLNDADMSALMQRAYNTINERNSKLRKVLGCKSSISIALKAFANNKISY